MSTRQSKVFWKSKVVWVNSISFIIAAIALVQTSSLIPQEYSEVFVLVLALLNLGLRFITVGPIRGGGQ